MEIDFGIVNGFMLPTTLTAKIDEPHLALSVNGEFKDYTFDFASAYSTGRNLEYPARRPML
jgi:hypothetical protein